MKTFYFKNIFLGVVITALFTGCVDDNDAALPPFETIVWQERFNELNDNEVLAIQDWTNYAQAGTKQWTSQTYSGNGYAEFTSYQSSDASNVAWLITSAIPLEANNDRFLKFAVAQSFVSSTANKLEVFISTDYDGTDVQAATWTQLDAKIPDADAEYYKFYDSGAMSLSAFSGNVYIAFKYTGSGTNTSLDGTYQIDDVSIYYN